ncbi:MULTISPECIES: GNAT family N-acetyltransferase [unclassified Undibacterium]|uniref:GNAT family N-acetyltransferase n=1 Tax=unclassified Undibacterium TaxID=2630295 RepID=UPI002AC9CB84|nr:MULTISPECIES: GNAT family N-acetyltransferase [unclassified Undibacterium]MEB0137670.1 GNAT family N-acetyltransferase [Undibacterium sp. CCC2.1]MEB0172678.1 GNAT family N-acetyltransferase [Undibacterium sp. CCC1.1]MEB0177380.1 GNAT family N-acetyltransferase [Undibacterium sp. CCC3.4]MEB0215473.1 GNAT family N-acetyltransferase [Undibacterium sp. 5I2]WPX42244.1 GNAT family N-acetyltransferase [Undibacterium sp. CCC3.4]
MYTERLLLRRFTLDDAAAYLPLVADPAILRYTGEAALTSVDAAREILQTRPLRDYQVHGFGRMACIERASGRLIGFCGLKYLDEIQEVDIGYRFLPACWGKGYASESAAALLAQAFELYQLPRVIGLVQPDNLASAQVLKKLGLQYETSIDHVDGTPTYDVYALERAQSA